MMKIQQKDYVATILRIQNAPRIQAAEFHPPDLLKSYFTSAFETFYTRTRSSHSKAFIYLKFLKIISLKKLICNEVVIWQYASLQIKFLHTSSFIYLAFILSERIIIISCEESLKLWKQSNVTCNLPVHLWFICSLMIQVNFVLVDYGSWSQFLLNVLGLFVSCNTKTPFFFFYIFINIPEKWDLVPWTLICRTTGFETPNPGYPKIF